MAEIKPDTNVQAKFRMASCETPPSGESILWWMEQFKATTSMQKGKRPGLPSMSP
jgi:hypothetical protein